MATKKKSYKYLQDAVSDFKNYCLENRCFMSSVKLQKELIRRRKSVSVECRVAFTTIMVEWLKEYIKTQFTD